MNWLWMGCFLASALFLFLAVKNLLFSSGKTVFRIVEVTLYMAAAAVLLYAPVFFLQYTFLTALTADLINIMRIISLDAGYLDHTAFIEEHIGTGLFGRLYMAILGVVHFAMPLISVLALYRVLFRFYSNMMLKLVSLFGRKTFYVFSEINEGTVRLATDIRLNGKRGNFIFADASESDQKKGSERLGNAILHPDSIQNIPLFEKGEVFYFFLSEDMDSNMTAALDLIGSLTGLKEKKQQKVHLYIATCSDEAESLVDSAQKGAVDVNLLKTSEVAVYNLLDKHPLFESAKDEVISVLVIGLDDMGSAAVKAVSWCGQMAGYRLKINVAGIGIGEKTDTFQDSYPGLCSSSLLELHFYDCAGNTELFDTVRNVCGDTTYAIVTAENDMKAAEIAIRLRREFLEAGGTFTNMPEIHACIRNEDQARVLDGLKTSDRNGEHSVSYGIDTFGSDEETYTWENILDSDYECLAGSVHMAYESMRGEEKREEEEAIGDYNEFEVNKRASRAYAMHIRYKLAQLGLDYGRDVKEEEADFSAALTGEELEELAAAEHNRWQMFLLSEGWKEAEPSASAAYTAAGIGGERGKSRLMKMHPYLCSYEEMPARAAALGQENTPVSDRELVRLIPEILHDRWETSGVRYKIVRRKK